MATHYEATLTHAGVDPAVTEVEWTVLKSRLFDEMQVPFYSYSNTPLQPVMFYSRVLLFIMIITDGYFLILPGITVIFSVIIAMIRNRS